MDELREIRVEQEMPRWRLAERILMERALPWSRITAELERSLVQDVRLKSIQRTRGTDQTVQLKLRGESKNPDSEAEFIVSLHKNLSFEQVILDRESETSGKRGSTLEFDYTLLLNTEPPPYEPLPKYGPERKAGWVESTPEPPPPPEPKPSPTREPEPPPPPEIPPNPPPRPRPQRQLPGSDSFRDRPERPERTRTVRRPGSEQGQEGRRAR
jgi:hypothetical protein